MTHTVEKPHTDITSAVWLESVDAALMASDMTKNSSVLLTPGCQTLWLLSPSMLFLYDDIVMDKTDLDTVLNPSRDSAFNRMKAHMAAALVDWGRLRTIDFSEPLDVQTRTRIHTSAGEIIQEFMPKDGEAMRESAFYKTGLHTHREYAKYLENTLMCCPGEDEATIRTVRHKLLMVYDRIRRLEALDVTDELLQRVAWTSERICAKVVAGLTVAARTERVTLYDTEEYEPFIPHVVSGEPELRAAFSSEKEYAPLRVAVASLVKKRVPKVRPVDDFRLFSSLRDEEEFEILRGVLRRIEETFGAMLEEQSGTVVEWLIREFERLEQKYEEIVGRISDRRGRTLTWTAIKMLASQVAGFMSPLIDKGERAGERSIRLRESERLLSRADLAAHLFFLAEVWKRYKVLDDAESTKTAKPHVPEQIWGEDEEDLPWYEVGRQES